MLRRLKPTSLVDCTTLQRVQQRVAGTSLLRLTITYSATDSVTSSLTLQHSIKTFMYLFTELYPICFGLYAVIIREVICSMWKSCWPDICIRHAFAMRYSINRCDGGLQVVQCAETMLGLCLDYFFIFKLPAEMCRSNIANK